ncbi:MAG: hypothetical protein PHT19_15060 [Methylococcus sp.]|nr:hypothetical protein [Methylococcus sp.]
MQSAVFGFGIELPKRLERLARGPDQAAPHIFEMIDLVAEAQRRVAGRRLTLVGVEIEVVDAGGIDLPGADCAGEKQQRENGEPDQR